MSHLVCYPAFPELDVCAGEIDGSKTETIKVSRQGSWWTLRKKEEPKEGPRNEQVTEAAISRRPTASRSESSFWTPRRRGSDSSSKEDTPLPPLPTSSDSGRKASAEVVPGHRAPPSRSNTFDFWPMRKTEEPEEISTDQRPSPSKTMSEPDLTSTKPRSRGNTVDGKRADC